MILKIITDEVFALSLFVSLLVLAIFNFHINVFALLALAVVFAGIYFLGFMMLKVFAPSIYSQDGRYEDCIKYVDRVLARSYSVVKLLGGIRLHNYFRLYSAYSYMRLAELKKAKEILGEIDETSVFPAQFLKLKVLNASLLCAKGEFRKALDSLTSLTVNKLPKKIIPDMFYVVSQCYLEEGIEFDRAMNYAQVAYNIRGFDPDFKINYAVALYRCKKDASSALSLLSEVNEGFESLTVYAKQRLLYYLHKTALELDPNASKAYYERLRREFSDSGYLKRA